MMPHRKNVLTWCILMYHLIALKQTWGIKHVTPREAKTSLVSRSTGIEKQYGPARDHKAGSLKPRQRSD